MSRADMRKAMQREGCSHTSNGIDLLRSIGRSPSPKWSAAELRWLHGGVESTN